MGLPYWERRKKEEANERNSPLSPAHMDWASHFPAFVDPDENKRNEGGYRQLVKDVEVVDIGCGFGGLLAGLAPVLPDTLIVGPYNEHFFAHWIPY